MYCGSSASVGRCEARSARGRKWQGSTAFAVEAVFTAIRGEMERVFSKNLCLRERTPTRSHVCETSCQAGSEDFRHSVLEGAKWQAIAHSTWMVPLQEFYVYSDVTHTHTLGRSRVNPERQEEKKKRTQTTGKQRRAGREQTDLKNPTTHYREHGGEIRDRMVD